MNLIMILLLLLLGTSFVSGHSIKKLEIDNKTDADIYEIKEDAATNTVAFVNPKVDKPTLREIVYYHMIERPYGPEEGRVRYDSEEGPEIDETMRPFTNSHGFPFLESVEKELDKEIKNELKEDSAEEKEEIVIEEIPKEGGEDDVIYEVFYDEEISINDDKSTKQEESKENLSTVAPEILNETSAEAKVEETTETATKRSDAETVIIDTSLDQEPTEAPVIDEITQADTVIESTTTPVSEEPVFEKNAKSARKLLFDRVKERYYSKTNVTQNTPPASERRKREINMHIPEAPKLGKLNYDSLPPYLRKLISTEKPKTRIIPDSESDEEEKLEDIKHRMHKLMSTLKTSDSIEEAEHKPRTYGMNLTADSGYVWNDMTNPGIHYNVEASESIEEEAKISPEEDHKKDSKIYNHGRHDYEESNKSFEESKKNSFEDNGRKRNKHKEKDDTISQLMESDQFWTWLADWTSVYMDVLTEHIKEAVHQEVVDQIKMQDEEREKDNKQSKPTEIPEPVDKNTDKNYVDNTTPVPVKENEKSESNNKEEKVDVDESEDTLLIKELEDRKKMDETQIIKDEETNKNNTKEENNQLKEKAKVQAQNVYGNTIGGEKVTNIFIFYPNENPDKLIQDVTKLNDPSTVNIDVRLNVPDEDKNDKVNKKDESTKVSVEKKTDVPTDITTEAHKEESTKTPEDLEDKSTPELVSQMPTTTTQEVTTVEQTEKTTENPPTTESSKVETTTELNQEENVPKDKIEINSKIDAENKKEIEENKTVESKTEENEKHDNVEEKNVTTTEKNETKEKIEASTVKIDESKPEITTELPK